MMSSMLKISSCINNNSTVGLYDTELFLNVAEFYFVCLSGLLHNLDSQLCLGCADEMLKCYF